MSPEKQAIELKYEFSEFTNLSADELNILCSKVCDVVLNAGKQDVVNQYFDDNHWRKVKSYFI